MSPDSVRLEISPHNLNLADIFECFGVKSAYESLISLFKFKTIKIIYFELEG